MRKEALGKLVAEVEAEDEKEVARDMMVERFGPSCAGWLTFEHRRLLKASGAFDVIVPKKVKGERYEVPMWFGLAISFLTRRPGWSVDVVDRWRHKRYRITWARRGTFKPVSRETETVLH